MGWQTGVRRTSVNYEQLPPGRNSDMWRSLPQAQRVRRGCKSSNLQLGRMATLQRHDSSLGQGKA
jgi:hypothetical protein